MRTSRRIPALLALAILIALAALLSLSGSAAAQTTVDYDLDNDGLIDIKTHAQLNAIRWDLDGDGDPASGNATAYGNAFPNRITATSGRMGCPTTGGCTGYELIANIDLDTDGDGSIGTDTGDAYYNGGAGWMPIGDSTNGWSAIFKGNGYTVKNLYTNRSAATFQGLFGRDDSSGKIESLGVTNANLTVGGTSGILIGNSRGSVIACYATGSITGTGTSIGGLVGYLSNNASITSSYSTATVSGGPETGGLLGFQFGNNSSVTDSYATGAVSGTGNNVGGLIGAKSLSGTLTTSYFDNQTTTRTTSPGGGAGQSTSNLQTPTGYTGIYSTWNANIDGVTGNDDPWDFGTSSQYPVLKYGGHSRVAQGRASIDYDLDGDNYIEVSTHAQLNAVRYDLNGDGNPESGPAEWRVVFPSAAEDAGCAATCTGYELTGDIDLDTDGDGSIGTDTGDAYYNGGAGWMPIGDNANRYSGDFKGNGFTVANMYISRNTTTGVGLFGVTTATADLESVGVTSANVTGNQYAGALVGASRGTVKACWSSGSVTATSTIGVVGGLVGWSPNANAITTSYSHASATGRVHVGGLLGAAQGSATVINSYATGTVTRTSPSPSTLIGGLMGSGGTSAGTASYYDTQTTGCVTGGTAGCTTSAGGTGVTGQTTSALQTPVGYTGIYANWNANLDGVAGNDDPWYFGTTSQYPTLKYGKTDYDEDNDGYIDISTHAQLNAVRWDLDADGDPTSGSATAYNTAFPLRFTGAGGRMGCPSSGCTGYELAADIDLDTNGDGSVTVTGDAYWNSGSGWNPIGTYTSNFKGNGHTINNLYINRTSGSVGLFGRTSGARIETLGVTNANVRGGANTGILIGYMTRGAVVACYTTGKVQGGDQTGGLVGYNGFNGGDINTTYSTAYVNGGEYVGGLVGFNSRASITNSYSTGRVDGSANVGGFLGNSFAQSTQSNNYWDTSASGRSNGIGTVATGALPGSSAGVTGKTTRELQTVTTYTGIYSAWNNNLDGVTGNDDPWAFGNGMQYPMLDYKSMSVNPQGGQAMGRSHNWNAPIVGELASVRLTAAAFPNRNGKWIWERSDNGDTWETISGSRSPTYEYTPTTSDVNHYLRAKVALNDGSFAYTRNLGGRVKNASVAADATQGSAVSFVSGNASPRVGTAIVASDPRPTGAVDARIGWQRCPNTAAPHTDCVYISEDSWCDFYTPVAADVGNYLRMYIYYATSAGVWTRHETGFTGQVAASQ